MKLLVAEDQPMLRDALCQLLLMEEHVEAVVQAGDGAEAIACLQKEKVDVLILDIEMPKMTGLDVLEWARQHCDVKVVMVTTFKRPGYFERAVKADVDAYVLKDRSISELMGTLDRVMAGQKEYSAELMEDLISHPNPLTDQENKLLKLIAQGLSNKEIASQLYLSQGTVRNYVTTILSKLAATNRTEAVQRAREHGWL